MVFIYFPTTCDVATGLPDRRHKKVMGLRVFKTLIINLFSTGVILSHAFIIILKKQMENVNKTEENEWEYKGCPSWFKMLNIRLERG